MLLISFRFQAGGPIGEANIATGGPDGPKAQKVFVKTGESFQGRIIISEGLEGGESVIVDGARGLTDNELIKVDEKKLTQVN